MMLRSEQRKFIKRNFTAILAPASLFVFALLVAPFMFITNSQEELVEVHGTFSKLNVINGSTNEDNVFEIAIKQMPGRVFLVEKMRVPDQILFTSDEKKGNDAVFTVEKSKLEDFALARVPVLELSTDKNKYLYMTQDMGKIMRANRGFSIFLFIVFIGTGVWLLRRLRARFAKEKEQPDLPEDFDPYIVWVAKHPLEFAGITLFVLYIVLASALPDGTGQYSFFGCASAYGYVFYRLRHSKKKFKWMEQALENEKERLARKAPRTETVAPKHVQAVELLLKLGKINSKNDHGQAALHIASTKGQVEAIDLLLRNQAEINVLDENLETPLMIAAKGGQYGAVMKLVDKHADVLLKNKDGKTALVLAEEAKKNPAIVSTLKKATVHAEALIKAAAEKAAKEAAEKAKIAALKKA